MPLHPCGRGVSGRRNLTARRAWAEGLGSTTPATPNDPAGARASVLDGDEITHRVETGLPYLACVLGGRAARHVFLPCNNFDGIDQQGLPAFPRRDTLGE